MRRNVCAIPSVLFLAISLLSGCSLPRAGLHGRDSLKNCRPDEQARAEHAGHLVKRFSEATRSQLSLHQDKPGLYRIEGQVNYGVPHSERIIDWIDQEIWDISTGHRAECSYAESIGIIDVLDKLMSEYRFNMLRNQPSRDIRLHPQLY